MEKKKKLPTLSDSDIVTTQQSKDIMQSSARHLSTIAIALALTTGGATLTSCSDGSDCDADVTRFSDSNDVGSYDTGTIADNTDIGRYDSTTYADSKPCD